MIRTFTKSISAILYERVTSPLYGAFIISWSIWNWEILYLTLFVDENKLNVTKIDYIINNCYSLKLLLFYPLLSTVLIILIIPFFGNAAYYVNLIFEQWKINQKNKIENNKLLTLEQSIALREELVNQTEKFIKMTKDKDDEIGRLNALIQANKTIRKDKTNTLEKQSDKSVNDAIKKIIENPLFKDYVPEILGNASRGVYQNKENYNDQNFQRVLEYLVSSGYLTRGKQSVLFFEMTPKGHELYKEYFEMNFK